MQPKENELNAALIYLQDILAVDKFVELLQKHGVIGDAGSVVPLDDTHPLLPAESRIA